MVWVDEVDSSFPYPLKYRFFACCVSCVGLDSCRRNKDPRHPPRASNLHPAASKSHDPPDLNLPTSRFQFSNCNCEIFACLFLSKCPSYLLFARNIFRAALCGALQLEKCVSGMASSVTLDKLKEPLMKERQHLQKAKDAILEQLKVLKVSVCTSLLTYFSLFPSRLNRLQFSGSYRLTATVKADRHWALYRQQAIRTWR